MHRRWAAIGGRLVSLHVVELGLACCGVEVREARRAADLLDDLGPTGAAGAGAEDRGAGWPPEAALQVLVVAGTVTARLAPALAAAYHQLAEPRAVLAFGACAATGGPYWDSYSVLPGAHAVVPVDAWVAGCPPRPADLVAGLEEVLRAGR